MILWSSDSGEQMVKCTKSQVRQLKTALRWKLPASQRERIQMVLLRESGMTQPANSTGSDGTSTHCPVTSYFQP